MAKLRSGKNTHSDKIDRKKPKQCFKLKDLSIRLKKLSESEIESLLNPPKKYSLRNRRVEIKKPIVKRKIEESTTKTKQIATITSSVIWKNLTSSSNTLLPLHPTDIVLAKMGTFRPWPARVNSTYRVGNVVKCYVLFYGTMQIGSVLRSECVKVCDCNLYLSTAINEIKSKFKWSLDYDYLSATQDIQRSIAIIKLTQVQKFFLAVRDMERLCGVPNDVSMIKEPNI